MSLGGITPSGIVKKGVENNRVTNTREAWAAFLNPEMVRSKLVTAGLFLVAHEMLLDTIKRHPLSFFADRWTAKGPEPSPKYISEVLALDPKGKGDTLRGSIAWLRKIEVIAEEDEKAIRTVTDARNGLAHEMSAMVSGSKPPDFVEHFSALLALTDKIEKWWIVNVEMATNPDYDGGAIAAADIVSGPAWSMHILGRKLIKCLED